MADDIYEIQKEQMDCTMRQRALELAVQWRGGPDAKGLVDDAAKFYAFMKGRPSASPRKRKGKK